MKRLFFVVATTMLSVLSYAQVYYDGMYAGSGWDIYVAGNYRYGPSIIINDDNSLDAWFAAPGGSYGTNTYSGTQSYETIGVGKTVGEVFTAPRDFYTIALHCYTASSTTERFTLKMYNYKDSYEESVKQTPIYTKTYNLSHGGWVYGLYSEAAEGNYDVRFPAGMYVVEISDATEKAGLYNRTTSNSTYKIGRYTNGTLSGAAFEARILDSKAVSYWDVATYQHSDDGGKTWTTEQVAIQPTICTRDELSICDPCVVKWGEYYYLGYTSTENVAGTENHLYIARAKTPVGPWEKWNGTGWGGTKVEPIVTFVGASTCWGVGEPSMVIKDGLIYVYYSWDEATTTTRLATADINDPLWPGKLTQRGTVIDKSKIYGSDHCDVKYCDSLDMFFAIHTSNRMQAGAYINVWTSPDGVKFTLRGRIKGAEKDGLHNCGFSGDAQGHIDLNKTQYLSYAYGIASWGKWNTWFQPLAYNSPLDFKMASLVDHSKASGKMDAGFPSTASADASDYKSAYQATAADGIVYASDYETGSFLSFPCLDVKGAVHYKDYVTSVNSYGIATDDAKNLIVRNDNNSSSPNKLLIYNHSNPTEKTEVNFSLEYPGATTYISASGDVFSNEGGYVYFFPKGQKYVGVVKIQNGTLSQVTSCGPLSVTGADSYVIPTHVPNHFYYQLRTKGILEYNGKDLGLKVAYSGKKAPSLNNTGGGAFVKLDNHSLLIYPSGASYGGGFTVIDLSVLNTCAAYAEDLGNISVTANRSMSQSICVEKKSDKTAWIYTYAMGAGYAVYQLTTETDPLTGINDIKVSVVKPVEGIFDLSGKLLPEVPSKGIYIVNGKKCMAK